ncbi:hypothetical protein SLA2020_015450 [Shorea laevis]
MPDQQQAFIDVEKDLTERETPMDRLICGDVGFGKTEGAFTCHPLCSFSRKASYGFGTHHCFSQIKQHFDVTSERFSRYPNIKVGLLSHFQV